MNAQICHPSKTQRTVADFDSVSFAFTEATSEDALEKIEADLIELIDILGKDFIHHAVTMENCRTLIWEHRSKQALVAARLSELFDERMP